MRLILLRPAAVLITAQFSLRPTEERIRHGGSPDSSVSADCQSLRRHRKLSSIQGIVRRFLWVNGYERLIAVSFGKVFRGDSRSEAQSNVSSIDFDDQGDYLVAAGEDETIRVFDVKEAKSTKTVPSKKYGVHLARFTHHSRQVLHASTKLDGMAPST